MKLFGSILLQNILIELYVRQKGRASKTDCGTKYRNDIISHVSNLVSSILYGHGVKEGAKFAGYKTVYNCSTTSSK